MPSTQIKKTGLIFGLIAIPASLFAAPLLSIDSTDFDLGIIKEGSVNVTRHTFIVKNTGDAVLKIENVKASCGCTAVDFDSIIAPGKTGKITQEINMTNIHGQFRKYMTVYSNAKNTPTQKLSLGGTLRADVEFSPEYLRFQLNSAQTLWQADLTINSVQSDLTVSDADFKPMDFGNSGPTWQQSIPLPLTSKLVRADKVSADGYYTYTLTLTLPNKGSIDKSGDIHIKTNNGKKPEISLTGVIGN